MKKFFAMMVLGLLLLTLTACGKAFTCSLCGQEKTGKQHTHEQYGVQMTICNECYQDINALWDN